MSANKGAIILALKQRRLEGVEDVRSYNGFMLKGNTMKSIICFELKIGGKWNPLLDPSFNTKKECVAKVREIKKYWRDNP